MTTPSLTSSVRSLTCAVILALFSLSGYAQNFTYSASGDHTIELTSNSFTDFSISGHGHVILKTNSSISISGDFLVSENITLECTKTINLNGDGNIHLGRINSDLFISGEHRLLSSIDFTAGSEIHFHNSRVELLDHSIKTSDAIYTGENDLVSTGGLIIADQKLSIEETPVISSLSDVVYTLESVDLDGASELPIHFFSVLQNTCGTGDGETPFTIDAQPVSNYNGENISCNGADDGVVECLVIGGSGNFTYEWFGNGSADNTNAIWTELGAGTSTVLVTDEDQGITCVDNVQMTEPPPLAIFSLNESAPSCSDVCNGSAFPIILGGTGSYTFSYDNGTNSQVALNLCEGENTLSISDFNNCTLDTTFVLEVDSITIDVQFTDSLCFGDNTGVASVDPSGGGGGPFIIDWFDNSNGNSVANLTAGSYEVVITDATGCEKDTTFTITEIPEIDITLDNSVSPVCAGDNDGEISVTISGGLEPYNLQWQLDGTNFSTDEDLSGLDEGTYSLLVTDNFGCENILDVTLEAQEALTIESSIEEIDCFGNCNAEINITITEGQEPYVITWTDENGFFSDQLSLADLCEGTYSLTLEDASGCTVEETFEITEPEDITVIETVEDVSCAGLSDGSITLEISGGQEPYILSVPFTELTPTSLIIDNLTEGILNVTLTDFNNCSTDLSYEVIEPEEIELTSIVQNPLCPLTSSGQIEIEISGGSEPYSVEWLELGVSNELVVMDLLAGDYTVEITDANNCVITETITLEDPEEINVVETITNVLCGAENTGAITLEVTNATEPLTVTWTGTGVQTDQLNQVNLEAGDYDLTLIDDNGCEFSATYTILEEEELMVLETITPLGCEGELGAIEISISGGVEPYNISWAEISADGQLEIQNLNSGIYTVTVIDANLCEIEVAYEIEETEPLVLNSTLTNPLCAGLDNGEIEIEITGGTEPYTINWIELGVTDQTSVVNLLSGDYTVEVTDANNCVISETITLENPEEITAVETITNVLCGGENTGAITLELMNASEPLSINWSGAGVIADQLNQTNLEAGDYDFTLTDANSCEFSTSYTITEEDELVVTENVTQPSCFGDLGAIDVEITGGVEPYTIVWTEISADGQPSISNLAPGTYTVTITDINLCEIEQSYIITAPEELVITSTFTQTSCVILEGAIEIEITGGTEPYTIDWTGVNAPDETIVEDLAPGNYSVLVTDALDCIAEASFTVNEPGQLAVIPTIVSESCLGSEDGSINLEVQNAVEPLTIIWTGNGVVADQLNQINLAPGSYSVDITDADGCGYVNTFEVEPADEITANFLLTQPGCTETEGSAELTISGGEEPYQIIWVELGLSDVLVANNILPGDYNVQITDANSCFLEQTFSIMEPGALDVSVNITDNSCAGEETGVLEAIINNGTAPFNVAWTGVDSPEELTQSGLASALYGLSITDEDGCEFNGNFEVAEPDEIIITETLSFPPCNAELGAIDISITGGTEPYLIEWLDIDADNQTAISDLTAGDYTVTVTDLNACSVEATFSLTEPEEITVEVDVTQPGCSETAGSLEITNISGGVEPYSTIWVEPNLLDTPLADDLAPGTYTLIIRDGNNCELQQMFTINEPGTLDVTSNFSNVSCNGGSDGSITLTVNDGEDPLSVVWTPGLGNELIQDDLSAGTYSVLITDASGCEYANDFELTESEGLTVSETVINPICFGETGGITLEITGGTEPYSIQWEGLNLADQTEVSDLPVGDYTANITDINGCEASSTITITSPDEINIDSSVTSPGCTGDTTGEIEIAISGGTQPYSITWLEISADGQTIVTDLDPGTYTVEVVDDNDCMSVASFEILPPGVLGVTPQIINNNCAGESEGAIFLTVSNAVEPLTVVWTAPIPLDNNLNQTNLPSDIYEVDITDANGCEFSAVFQITESSELQVTETIPSIRCNGELGIIDIEITGGVEPYSIIWTDQNFDGQTSLTDLPVGTYEVIVTDANGCEVIENYTLTEPDELELVATITQPLCAGETGDIDIEITGGSGEYTISWEELDADGALTLTDLEAGTYTITVLDENDCEVSASYEIILINELNTGLNITQPECFFEFGMAELSPAGGTEPYTITWTGVDADGELVVEDLTPGSYSVEITDANDCSVSETFEIETSFEIEVTAVVSGVLCNGDNTGSIEIDVDNTTGITSFLWTNTDTGFSSPTEDIFNLSAGSYSLEITDELGCGFTQTYEVTELESIEITIDQVVPETCSGESDGSIEISISGGTPDYNVSWSSIGFTSVDEEIFNLSPGNYSVLVEDINGCIGSSEITVESGSEIIADVEVIDSECSESTGSAEAAITSDADITSIEWFNEDNILISETESITDQTSGVYTLIITNAVGCSLEQTVTISDTDAALIEATVTEISCPGETDGSIEINIISGTDPYTLSWTGPVVIPDDDYNLINLSAGLYTAQVTDSEGCVSILEIDLEEPAPLVISTDVLNVSCNGELDGSISLEITGGTEPYNIDWLALTDDQLIQENLEPGDYSVTVTDANMCTTEASFSITEETPLELEMSTSELLCAEEETTDIDITISGGVTPYTFLWTGDISSDNEDLGGVAPGTYNITVTDATGCQVSDEVIISQNSELIIDVLEVEPSCLNNDGELTAEITGGTEPYQFFWYDASTSTLISEDQTLSAISAGEYFFEVFDDAGCTSSQTVNLSNNQGEVTANITDLICADDDSGVIELEVSGLVVPIEFSWTGPNGYTSVDEDIFNLSEGDYTVTITDGNGCQLIETYSVNSTDLLEVSFDITNICFNDVNTGAINATITGGVQPYEISWSGNGIISDQSEITDLPEGCYDLEVIDENGCFFNTQICINTLDEILTQTTAVSNVCFSDYLGEIALEITGGDPVYTVEWQNSNGDVISDEQDISGLITDTYFVSITDESGCSAETSEVIDSNPEITADLSISPIVCNSDENGEISISYAGGVGDLSISWTGPNGFSSNDDDLTGLDNGEYCYTITDALGCELSNCITLDDPEILTAAADFNNISCFGLNDGNISITAEGGYTPYTQNWTLDGVDHSTELDIENLSLGEYALTLTDSMGCEVMETIVISEPTALELTLDNIIGSTCENSQDGVFELTATGGTPDYSYSWSNADGEQSQEEDPNTLNSGTFTVVVTDLNNCNAELTDLELPALGIVNVEVPESVAWCFTEFNQLIEALESEASSVEWQEIDGAVLSQTDSVFYTNDPGVYELIFIGTDGPCVVSDTTEVTIYELPEVDAGADQEAFLETDVVLGADPVTDASNTVAWSPGDLLIDEDSTAFNPIYFALEDEVEFIVTATSADGCTSSDSVLIVLFPDLDVHTGFTPNDDSMNDTWVLGNYQNFPSIEVWVYNRWGEQLFYSAGYNEPWNGTYQGEKLPIGTYYYVITINEPTLEKTLDGPVTILR